MCENNHDVLQAICTEKQKGTCSFPGRKMYYKCVSMTWISWSSLSIVGRDCSHSPVTWKWQIFFSSNCCFKAVLLWHLSNLLIWIEEILLNPCGCVCVFFYTARLNITMFQWSAKQKREADREHNIWDLSSANRDIFKNRHCSPHHVSVISLMLLPL